MVIKKLSLRTRIFLAMFFLVIIASVLIVGVTINQYHSQTKDYHSKRLFRKESNIKDHINIILNSRENSYPISTKYIPNIFKTALYEVGAVHKMEVNLYDLEGGLLKSSKQVFASDSLDLCLPFEILQELKFNSQHRLVKEIKVDSDFYLSSYSYVYNKNSKVISILHIPYLENNKFLASELESFLLNLSFAYLLMLLFALLIAYFLSSYITKSLKIIGSVMRKTTLDKHNKKIEVFSSSVEIATLVASYNNMIDKLEESAVALAKTEREQAWREMAKQVAHEIKNPLTPMRLTVQSFQARFNPEDPNIISKLNDFSNSLIEQIDVMSSIASAFSNFAKLPEVKKERINLSQTILITSELFNKDFIKVQLPKEDVFIDFDKSQLIRVINNLLKNSLQALPNDQSYKEIKVVLEKNNNSLLLKVIDNGIGVSQDHLDKIFEPKFTTKTSGMGLGLAMCKNIIETYNGSISYEANIPKGAIFNIILPN